MLTKPDDLKRIRGRLLPLLIALLPWLLVRAGPSDCNQPQPPAAHEPLPPTSSGGAVVAWGSNDSGETDVPLVAKSGVVAISAGGLNYYGDRSIGYSLALKNDGSVVAWGFNNNLSTGLEFRQSQVPPGARTGVIALSAADFHAVALKMDGTLVAWGDNRTGQVTGTPNTRWGL